MQKIYPAMTSCSICYLVRLLVVYPSVIFVCAKICDANMLYTFNLLIINIVLYAKIASGDKRGTKICRPKEKRANIKFNFVHFKKNNARCI